MSPYRGTSASFITHAAALAAVLFLPAFSSGDGPKGVTNANVKVWVHLSRENFKPGDTGDISITVAPAEGYHVNARPPVEFRLDSAKTILLKGALSQVTDKSNGYLSTQSPIRQSFYVPSTIKPGFHVLKATVTYYYCSDSEGWCQRFRQPITLSFTVTQ